MPSRAPQDPYVTEFEARVERIDGTEVVLAETYFYPEGGGQPADRGELGGHEVLHVRKGDQGVVHQLAGEPPFGEGETVAGEIDEAYRTYLMRAHTASHALYGAGRRIFADVGYGGFGITDRKVRVDFRTSTDIDDGTLAELERQVNQAVWDSRPVTWERLAQAEALSRDDIAFNTKTEEGITGDQQVRVVEIEGWDVAACGGTHVGNTREIGPVTVLSRSNPGEGLTRVEFAVGPEAISRRKREALAARRAARTLDTTVLSLPEAVDRIDERRRELEAEVADLREEVVGARLADLADEAVSRNGVSWLAGTVPTGDANDLAEFAQDLTGDAADVVALVSESGSYLAVATDGQADAEAVVGDVTDRFGGGGGGGPTLAQAGGLQADPDDVVSFLRQ